MLTRNQILNDEHTSNAQHQQIDQTYAKRNESESAWQAWVDACETWHDSILASDFLWNDETRQKIRKGDREAIEDTLLYLEVDPWYFRSGYLKEHIISSLKQAPLTELDKERIRQIIINIAGGKNRREFRYYCRLALKVATDDFVLAIQQEAEKRDRESCGKFSYLLRFLLEHMKAA